MKNTISRYSNYTIVATVGLLATVVLCGRAFAQVDPASQLSANAVEATITAK